MEIQQVQQKFEEIYGAGGEILSFHSPGRVNLIGEHTDYNGGAVFPCALSFGTYGVARKRADNTLNFASTNMDLRVSCTLDDIDFKEEHDWANYLKGVIVEFQKLVATLGGLDILISGNIPNGAGLSSSASVEVLMSVILKTFFAFDIDTVDMVKLSQRAENQYIGVNCGIMDQFAIGMGKQEHAILLDCASLKYEYVPAKLGDHKLIIANTNKRRGLADSKYNERRSECDKAVEFLNKELSIKLLADITPEQFEQYKYLITDPVVLKRAEHVIYEIKRTLDAVDTLKAGDIAQFGQLMIGSHNSLRDLYEVTGIELDTLVAAALEAPGTVGSRMTGAGFGGCTVSVVKSECVDDFIKQVDAAYTEKIGYRPSFYIAEIGDGTKQI
ncbi:MAG: galactokinase [Clostridiales bacterium]|jgi:galactokinase|nr:galactokinase [Clostridiales bacterium]